MAIPSLPACELDTLDVPCGELFEEGEHMLTQILARLRPAFPESCGSIVGLITHSDPVTTASDYLAAWHLGDLEAPSQNPLFPEVESRWSLKLVESGHTLPFHREAGGIVPADLELIHAQSRILYSHGSLFRTALMTLCPDKLIPRTCSRARVVSFGPAAAGDAVLAGNAGWQATISYRRGA